MESAAWQLQDWNWDPFSLRAVPTHEKQAKPACSDNPDSAPSLDLGSASTQLVEDAQTAKAPGKGRPQCQVEGCCADLSSLKEYHQRYKICEYHLKVRPLLHRARRAAPHARVCGGRRRAPGRAGEQHRVRGAPPALLPAVRPLPRPRVLRRRQAQLPRAPAATQRAASQEGGRDRVVARGRAQRAPARRAQPGEEGRAGG